MFHYILLNSPLQQIFVQAFDVLVSQLTTSIALCPHALHNLCNMNNNFIKQAIHYIAICNKVIFNDYLAGLLQ